MVTRNVHWASFEGVSVSYDYSDTDEQTLAIRVNNPADSVRTLTISLLNPDGTVRAERSWPPSTSLTFNTRSLRQTRVRDVLGRDKPFGSIRFMWR